MTIAWGEFWAFLVGNPLFCATVLLTLGVIFVNGWTDAPNAIATCVSTRAMPVRPAIAMAAGMNLLGILGMTALNANVAQTLFTMVDFGRDSRAAVTALCAAMTAIVVWAVTAWVFGIPTSESHALVAGITGAAVAIHRGFEGVRADAWVKVLCGLALSATLGFGLGVCFGRWLRRLVARLERRSANARFRHGQVTAAALSAFMHGAQDGQKFLGIFLLGAFLARGQGTAAVFTVPLWLMLLCAAVMAAGTSVGGYRIIKRVGMGMVRLEAHEGFAADLAAVLCMLVASFGGLPVSTTHTKTTAILGVGAARGLRQVNWAAAREMALAWVLTFPGCGLVGWATALLFLRIF
ncbi:MAG: inorganic phosphate transporter [Oscillospiraceae bacterium]|nr:inorganic phosphate transporter [Oscillospiraceae bacterium]